MLFSECLQTILPVLAEIVIIDDATHISWQMVIPNIIDTLCR